VPVERRRNPSAADQSASRIGARGESAVSHERAKGMDARSERP
jgi:hypothetical protein